MSPLIVRNDEADVPAMTPPVQGDWPIHIGTGLDREERRLGNLFRAITEAGNCDKRPFHIFETSATQIFVVLNKIIDYGGRKEARKELLQVHL